MPKGKGGKGGRGGSAPRFNRQVPKFLQQYAHLLGAERPDPHGNDDMSFQSTAIEEGYDSDGVSRLTLINYVIITLQTFVSYDLLKTGSSCGEFLEGARKGEAR